MGAGSLVEYSNAQSDFVEAKSNRAQAVLQFIFQKKLLDYYLGKIDRHASLIKQISVSLFILPTPHEP